jgi:hypothetical protein
MTLWQILVVIGIIVVPLILSIWMTLWTVEKRGRGPTPYKRPEPKPSVEEQEPANEREPSGPS